MEELIEQVLAIHAMNKYQKRKCKNSRGAG